jgi:hypothetical protein
MAESRGPRLPHSLVHRHAPLGHPLGVIALRRALGAIVMSALLAGCTLPFADSRPDSSAAREFAAFPLYWVGERFEEWELTHIELPGPAGFATFVYGDCTPRGEDHPSCVPPLQIQVSPLCLNLDAVARARIWRERRVRNAPVGTIDSAPVLFTSGAQVKVYRGEGSDPGLPMRALQALRSVNRVEPVIGPDGPIPAPPSGVLEGARPCRA